ncbi:two-component response regulator-like APRR9 [Aristolochia californica]|uniref:two-component response regulator-like APRR9 n=1 Tax=Aristolochia californica TaxID=171875 RepID=UPI0035E0B86A
MSSTATFLANPSRKTRTKTKPKFLSLLREFSPESEMTTSRHGQQLNLFPLHPENLFEEKDVHDNVDYLFEQEAAGETLTGLLGVSSSSSEDREESSQSASLNNTYGAQNCDAVSSLAWSALRHREWDTSEEKWVSYSDVATKEKDHAPGLSLKLDYQEILNAWSDKGPLYIEEEGPQIVPDHDEVQAQGWTEVMRASSRVWQVPDDGSSAMEEDGHGKKMGQRQARVLRYKEKRQSRLFSKRIRYEVRKLNAEKRPRMKGRFVKRKIEA